MHPTVYQQRASLLLLILVLSALEKKAKRETIVKNEAVNSRGRNYQKELRRQI